MVMTQFVLAMEHDRDEFVPYGLKFGMQIDIDDAHRPPELGGKRRQCVDKFVAQMAPLAAEYGQFRFHLPARRLI